jgi:hypothetical protein
MASGKLAGYDTPEKLFAELLGLGLKSGASPNAFSTKTDRSQVELQVEPTSEVWKQERCPKCGGAATADSSLAHIRQARHWANRAEQLLEQLGHNLPAQSLSQRYRRCVRAAERGDWSHGQLEILAELQMVVHQLTALLQQEFYP